MRKIGKVGRRPLQGIARNGGRRKREGAEDGIDAAQHPEEEEGIRLRTYKF